MKELIHMTLYGVIAMARESEVPKEKLLKRINQIVEIAYKEEA